VTEHDDDFEDEAEDEDDDFEDEEDADFDDEEDDDEDEDDDDVAPEGNRVVGATARQTLEYIAKSIVDDPEAVFIDTDEGKGSVIFHVHVAPDDMGRLIGKRGRVAQAIRQVVAAAAHRDGVSANVEFVD
jgi:hypothetical protein